MSLTVHWLYALNEDEEETSQYHNKLTDRSRRTRPIDQLGKLVSVVTA